MGITQVVFDEEWDPKAAETDKQILWLGAAKLKDGKIDFFESKIRPQTKYIKTSHQFKLFTNLSDRELEKSETFPEVFRRFLEWVGEGEIEYYSWGDFDIKLLEQDLKRHKISQNIFKSIKNKYQDLQFIFKGFTYQTVSVETALKLYGERFIGRVHNPKYDSFNTLRVLKSMKKRPHYTELIRIKMLLGDNIPSRYVDFANTMDKCGTLNEAYMSEVASKVREQLNSDLLSIQKEFNRDMCELKEIRRLQRKMMKIKKRYHQLDIPDMAPQMNKITRCINSATQFLRNEKMTS